MTPIGDWVLRTACEQYCEWQRKGILPNEVILAVNVSAQQLAHGNLLHSIEKLFEETNFEPKAFELEITETSSIWDAQSAVDELRSINALGVRIALEDFGTGYSSLTHLKRLPVQTIENRSLLCQRLSAWRGQRAPG